MVGLIFLAPPFQAIGRKAVSATFGENGIAVSIANIIADSFSITLGAIIAVWPLVAYYFGIVSFVGLPATFLALPALPGIIITGTLAGGLGLIALPVAQAIGWLAWLFLSYMLLVVDVFAAIPLSSLELGPVNTTLIWAYYIILAIALWFISNSKRLSNLIPKAIAGLESGVNKITNSAMSIVMHIRTA